MRRYYFTAYFQNPQDGFEFDLVAPFDKVELTQRDGGPYPPSPDTCIVNIECQRHTILTTAIGADNNGHEIAEIEAQMEIAIAEMVASGAIYLGMEDIDAET